MEELSKGAKEFINSLNEVNEQLEFKKIEIPENTIPPIKPEVAYEDFVKVDIRMCQILSVEKVEKKDRLYKLNINTGIDERIVVSSIAHIFSPEELLLKVLPFVLNLPVRKIAGIESFGMIILADDILRENTLQISISNGFGGIGSILIQ